MGDFLYNSKWSEKYKNVLFVAEAGHSTGLDATARAVGTDDGDGTVTLAPFKLSSSLTTFTSTNALTFNTVNEKVYSSSSGILDLAAAGEIQLTTVLLDINATGDITIDTTDTSDGIKIGTSTADVPVLIGNASSATVIADALTVTGTTAHTDAVTMATGKKLQFVDGNEYISGDSSNITIGSSGRIHLTASSDVRIPGDVGFQFSNASYYIEYISASSQLAMVSGGALNTTAAAASTIKTTDGALTVHADGADDKVHIKGDHATGTAVQLECTHADGDMSITAGSSTGNITLSAGSSSTGLLDVNGYQLDLDTGSGGIQLDSTGNISIGALANAGSITIGTNTTARDITIGHQSSSSGLDLYAGTGKLTATSTGEVEITTTRNAASAMYLRTNGGTSETMIFHNDQGTDTRAIQITSDAGGIDVNAGKGMTIDTADTTTYKMTADSGSAKYFTIDAVNSGGGAAGVKVGTTSGTTVTIGHTTSETTVSDNLTVTGDLSVSGTQTYTDLAISDTSPTFTMTNSTAENIITGRESIISFKGKKASTTATTLGHIKADHATGDDDFKSQLTFAVNTNTGADVVANALRINTDLTSTFYGVIDGDAGLTVDGGSTLINQANGDHDTKIGSSTTDTLVMCDAGNNRVGVNVASPTATLSIGGTVAGKVLVTATAGPTDNVDVTGATVLQMNTSSNTVTIGGLAGGVAGQLLFVVKTNTSNDAILENVEGGGSQDIKLLSGNDETISNFGGWMLVCDGSNWFALGK